MHHVIFDVDGTLVDSYQFDEECFISSIKEVTGQDIISDWATYPHVTDTGILQTFIERQFPDYSLAELQLRVKKSFISKIEKHLGGSPAKEIKGARKFLEHLSKSQQYVVSIATGGWRETAELKLKSAGFDLQDILLSSSNDHHSRIEIMNLSISQAKSRSKNPITYFGDAEWDLNACNALGLNLVIVGDRVRHTQMIPDFSDVNLAVKYLKVAENQK